MIKKLSMFPTPKELGMSTSNAMQSRRFSPNCDGYTWEDYDSYLSKTFPIKWKIFTATKFISSIFRIYVSKPIGELFYLFLCMSFKKYKFHLLDLRQPYNKYEYDFYDYGYRDVSQRMVFAIFNLLKENFKHAYNLSKDYSLEEINNDFSLKAQYALYKEQEYLIHWWDISRKSDLKMMDEMTDQWSKLRQSSNKDDIEKASKLFESLNKAEMKMEEELDSMLIRAIKIRQGLWT